MSRAGQRDSRGKQSYAIGQGVFKSAEERGLAIPNAAVRRDSGVPGNVEALSLGEGVPGNSVATISRDRSAIVSSRDLGFGFSDPSFEMIHGLMGRRVT